MRATQAVKHLPHKVHLMEALFISPRAIEILNKLPHTGDADDEMVICCEEVVHLMDSIGFETDRTLQGAMSDQEWERHMKRVGGQAAFRFDHALSAHESMSTLPELPEGRLKVKEMAEILMPIRVITPTDVARNLNTPKPPPGVLASATEYPRAQAVKEAAVDIANFHELLHSVLPWFTEANRLDATKRHEATSMRALDSWLDGAGDKTEPMMIAHNLGSKSKTAEELTVWAFGIDEVVKAKFKSNTPSASATNLASMAAMAQVISHKVVHPDTTGTE